MTKTLPYFLAGVVLFSSGCASIVSKTSYPVAISSNPNQASVTIVNNKGDEVFTGLTPAIAQLKSGAGFFKKATYLVKIQKEGFDQQTLTVESSINGWYFGNILFGGLIGLLIVDPATGAMYKIDTKQLSANLTAKTADNSIKEERELRVLNINEIPSDWKDKLVKIN